MNIVVFSKIIEPIRIWIIERSNFLGGLITCSMCFSFWGGILSTLIYSPSNEFFFNNNTTLPIILLSAFINGLLSSGGVYFINSIVEKMERN